MIFRVFGAVLAGISLAVVPALAQTTQPRIVDLPPYQASTTWTGFYLGAGFGGGAMVDHLVASSGGISLTDDAGGQGVLAAIYGGYDFQVTPKALVGVLAEGSWTGIQSQAAANVLGANATASIQPNFGFSALIRAGVMPTPSNLLYLVGGYSGQNFHSTGNASAAGAVASFARDDFFNGWTLGAGFETQLQAGWSAKLEYRYSQFETRSLPGTSFVASPSLQTVRLGLTYRFGGGGAEGHESAADGGGATGKVNWTGLYLGAAGGGIASTNYLGASLPGLGGSIGAGSQGFLGSVFGGFDYQIAPQAVVGILGDVSFSNPQSITALSAGAVGASVSASSNTSWSVLARVGYLPTQSTLLYAAAGYTGEQVTTTANAFVGGANATISESDVVNGWTVGPGIETALGSGWSTKLEYRYSQYETKSLFGGGATIQPSTQTIRAGLSYRFGVGQ